jgi:3-oxoacyl-[acyl-carrier protein] reductase
VKSIAHFNSSTFQLFNLIFPSLLFEKHNQMNLNLQGKNALIGGSSKGIGKAIAIELAKLGANVTLMARSAELLAEVLQELDQNHPGQQHDFLVVDFNDRTALHQRVVGLLTVKPIHILINNTGGPNGGPILNAQPEQFLEAFQNHLLCNHLLAQLVIPKMKAAGFGRIVNVVSTSVRVPLDNLGVSNTTRGAVASWAKTLANEVAKDGITVNNVLPGFTETERLVEVLSGSAQRKGIALEQELQQARETIPAGRFGTAEEIASVAAFLCTPAAAYVTGTSILVDGGRTRSI